MAYEKLPDPVVRPRHALVVDDEPASRACLSALLAGIGLDVEAVASGSELLQRLALCPDLILLDTGLAEEDGYALCRALKQSERHAHIPVILVVEADEAPDLESGMAGGADDFVARPVTLPVLRARVRTLLRIQEERERFERLLEKRQALSYMIIHDLRNPLAAVSLYLQLLRRRSNNLIDPGNYLQVAMTQTHKISSFLDDMLLLAKMERGQLVLARTALVVDQIVAEVCQKLAPEAERQNNTIVVKCEGQPSPVSADPALIRRVVENLVLNALKFTPPQGTVTVRAFYPRSGCAGESGGAAVLFSVADQGRGIPPEDFVRMFDAYEAVHMKEALGKAELGLELAFCRMVVEAHGGRIYAGNNPDRGAVITVEL